jgi:hypothetical protein
MKKKNFEVPVMDAEFDDPDIEMVVLRLRMKRSHWVTERISCFARFDVRLPTKKDIFLQRKQLGLAICKSTPFKKAVPRPVPLLNVDVRRSRYGDGGAPAQNEGRPRGPQRHAEHHPALQRQPDLPPVTNRHQPSPRKDAGRALRVDGLHSEREGRGEAWFRFLRSVCLV